MPTALSIRADVLAKKGDVVCAFLSAYERAVDAINAVAGDTGAYLEFSAAAGIAPDSPIKAMLAGGIVSVPSIGVASCRARKTSLPRRIGRWASVCWKNERGRLTKVVVNIR